MKDEVIKERKVITFSMLPDRRPPWKEFMLTMGVQCIGLFLLTWVGAMFTGVLPAPVHAYHFIQLVATPSPVNVEPAPVKSFPAPQIARVTPALRVPESEVRPTPRPEIEPVAPQIEVTHKLVPFPPTVAVIPRELVKTNTFSTGSSAVPTIAAAPQHVQTGGFGGPNGVPAHESNGKAVNIAQSGSFDLPSGPGDGNGTGGAKGRPGVVASTGFGNGVATGDGSGRGNASRGTVQRTGFNDTAAVPAARPKTDDSASKTIPAEIISKPTPAYTEEARNLRIEGSVIVEAVFEASGRIRIVRVVQGLGHGLDESAVHAAEQIHFKPAKHDGQPADYTALVHIVFQLAG